MSENFPRFDETGAQKRIKVNAQDAVLNLFDFPSLEDSKKGIWDKSPDCKNTDVKSMVRTA